MFPMVMSQLTLDNAPIASPTFAKDDVTASNLLATPSSIVSNSLILLICLADSVNSFLAIVRFCDKVPKIPFKVNTLPANTDTPTLSRLHIALATAPRLVLNI